MYEQNSIESARSKAVLCWCILALSRILFTTEKRALEYPIAQKFGGGVVGGERKESCYFFLSDLFILVRNATCVNFYGNAAWFTTQYLEEISRRRKIEAGMITFPPFSFYFLRAIHSLDYYSSRLYSSQITFFFFFLFNLFLLDQGISLRELLF